MKLQTIRLCNFQSFGPEPTDLNLEEITYLIGPNGSGKTAALQALCRLFAFDPSLRKIQRSDFHVPVDEMEIPEKRQLWIEANFVFPELKDNEGNATVAPNFAHMRLDHPDDLPRVRYRLTATLEADGDIEDSLDYVLDIEANGTPITTAPVPKQERNQVQVHYLPARRDPADHIAYGASALLGRLLRAVNWEHEREVVKDLTQQISNSLADNPSISAVSECLNDAWKTLHKGTYFADPKITFVASEIEALLRHLSVSFSPGHAENLVDFVRLSDGQKSMLYLSLVMSSQAVGRAVISGENTSFDPEKVRPPAFTLIAMEEPENSLSPYYLGRIVNALESMTSNGDAQALIATHAPSMLRRVDPTKIRHFRLTQDRATVVKQIRLPERSDDAHKFVRAAVQAFPEIYLSRLVILGEGDSEEIVLPRILRAKGIPVDEHAVAIAPLGGRHVNHFWRLLTELEIPYLTLLDLDLARHQGGWGRVKYVVDKINEFGSNEMRASVADLGTIPAWNTDTDHLNNRWASVRDPLERLGVYFSAPLDLDFAMLNAYREAYGVAESDLDDPDESDLKSVLGKGRHGANQYSSDEQKLFGPYHSLFKVGSKPATHIGALSTLSDEELVASIPQCLDRLGAAVIAKLAELPE